MWSCSGHLLHKEPEASVPQQNTLEGESQDRRHLQGQSIKTANFAALSIHPLQHDQTRRALCERGQEGGRISWDLAFSPLRWK